MFLLSSAVGGTQNTAIYKSHVLNVLKLQRKIISQALGSKGKIWGHRGEARFGSVRLLEYRFFGYLLQLKIILLKCSLYVKPPQIAILPFCISFSWGWSWSLPPVQCHKPLPIVHQALCLSNLNPWIHLSLPLYNHQSVQFSSVAQLCLTLCDPMNHSTPRLPVHHQLPEFTQTRAHRVSDAIQPSHSLLSPSPPALNLSHHQGLFQWVSSLHEVAKVLEFQL